MKRKILFDTGFFHVHFDGLSELTKTVLKEVYEGKSLGYTLDLNLAEFVYGKLKGLEAAKAKLSVILNSPIKVVSTDRNLAMRAGELRLKHHDLSLVDCFVIALAEREGQ